jgi:transposase
MARKSNKKKYFHAGIDVSKRTLVVAWRNLKGNVEITEFSNDEAGHKALIGMLRPRKRAVRVVLEATGNYSVDVALALHAAGVEVMIANPLATRRFADSKLRRSKTDAVDAKDLLEFAETRTSFVVWTPPPAEVVQLRDIARHMHALSQRKQTVEVQLHAVKAKQDTHALVLADLKGEIAVLEARIEAMCSGAIELTKAHSELNEAMRTVMTVKGIAERSAVRLLGELLHLPTDMTPDQVVAHAGLDPRKQQSGTSLNKTTGISKRGNQRIRASLFMPVLVAIQHEPTIKAVYDGMLAQKKPKKVAQTAIMRRLLRVLWKMVRSKTAFDGSKFAPAVEKMRTAA